MQSLILCYSKADEATAFELANFIEVNCPSPALHTPVVFDSGDELLESVDQALSADIAVVLLSPSAVPVVWRREEWEAVFVKQAAELQTALVFLLVRPCKFPEVLRRRNSFFDSSAYQLDGFRGVRRWLLKNNPLAQAQKAELPPRVRGLSNVSEELDRLERLLVDKPGVARDIPGSVALEFAHAHEEDFEGVFWVDCAMRSLTGVLGHTGGLLGLQLLGPAEQNQNELKGFCAGRRLLLVFEDLAETDWEAVTFGGSSSVLFTLRNAQRAVRPLEDLLELFGRGDERFHLDALGEAQTHLEALSKDPSGNGSPALNRLGAGMFSLLHKHGRWAEADEVLGFLIEDAYANGDSAALRLWEWERTWIRGSWGEASKPRTRLGGDPQPPEQLGLF